MGNVRWTKLVDSDIFIPSPRLCLLCVFVYCFLAFLRNCRALCKIFIQNVLWILTSVYHCIGIFIYFDNCCMGWGIAVTRLIMIGLVSQCWSQLILRPLASTRIQLLILRTTLSLIKLFRHDRLFRRLDHAEVAR